MPTNSQAFAGAVGLVFFSVVAGCGVEPGEQDAIGVSEQALTSRHGNGRGNGRGNGHGHGKGHSKGHGKGHHSHGNGHGFGHGDCDQDDCDTVDTSCDGIDNDCNGLIDDGFQSTSTSCGLGLCASSGATSCVAGAVIDSCAPAAGAPDDSICDGIDNDCNGSVDEDFQSTGTSCGLGVCAANGATSCVAGTLIDSCAPGAGAPNDASCDGIDDDCNGLMDEDFQPTGTTCGFGICASSGATSCIAGTVIDLCMPAPGAAYDDSSCDGVDNDCNGAVDEDYQSACTGSTAVTTCVDGIESEHACAGTICTPAECAGGCYDDSVNVLRNASFETVPNASLGQGLICSEWTHLVNSAETYSNDGSYGLPPGGFNHFNGEVAQDGIRWVAGGSFPESIGQVLTTPLTPGAAYNVSAWLIQDNGALNRPGSYLVRLWNGTGAPGSAVSVGAFAPTVSSAESWVFRSFCFVAPANASALPHFVLEQTSTGANLSYPGIDNVQVVETCGCP